MTSNSAPKLATSGGSAGDSARAPRVGNLRRSSDILRECRRIYRLARTGELETTDMGRYIAALQTMINIMRDTSLEERIAQLEQLNNVQQPQP